MQYALFEVIQRDAIRTQLEGLGSLGMSGGDFEILTGPSHTVQGAVVGLSDWIGAERAALRYNVPSSSVAAWKAHATRGTYEAVAPVQCTPMYFGPLWPTLGPSFTVHESMARRLALSLLRGRQTRVEEFVARAGEFRELAKAASAAMVDKTESLLWGTLMQNMQNADFHPFLMGAAPCVGRLNRIGAEWDQEDLRRFLGNWEKNSAMLSATRWAA
jgi:hypothetical protein